MFFRNSFWPLLFLSGLIWSVSPDIVFSQNNLPDPGESIIWRGFNHEWTYNHRINRIGSFVSEDENGPFLAHTSATGTGADSTNYKTFYTRVGSRAVQFHSGKVSVELESKKGKLDSERISVRILPDDDLKDRKYYTCLLNGFDLLAIDRAEKLELLKIDMGEPVIDQETGEILFEIEVVMVTACQSFECQKFKQVTSYEMDIYYLLIGGDDNFNFTNQDFTKNYDWDKKEELTKPSQSSEIKGIGDNRFSEATLGITSINLILDKAHWLLEWNNSIQPISYIPDSGKLTFTFDLLFKEWTEGMRRNSANPKQSRFSFKKPGWVSMSLGIVLLQFRDGAVEYLEDEGSMYWSGKNLSPTASNQSINIREIRQPD